MGGGEGEAVPVYYLFKEENERVSTVKKVHGLAFGKA